MTSARSAPPTRRWPTATPTWTAPRAPRCPRRSSRPSPRPTATGLGNTGGVFPASARSQAITDRCRAAIAALTGGQPGGVILGPSMTALTYRLAGTLARDWRDGRRGHRVAAGPRRQRAALGAGRRAGRRGGPVGRARPGHRRAARRPVRRAAVAAHPAGRRDRGQQPHRHPARRARHHRRRQGRGRAELRGRRARHPARADRRGRARRGLLRHQRLQVVRAAPGRRGGRPRAAGHAAPGQAGPGAGRGAGLLRARHAAVRRPGRGGGRGGAPGRAGRPGRPAACASGCWPR